ncbi:MAG: hypothetical protein KKC03_13810 [Bacteroidetes bacterium]|nr:hypothetical protein [Bacteroidota bacterium]
MLALELMNAMIAELKKITELGVRVYAAQSRNITFQGEKPYAKVIYGGADIIYQKSGSEHYRHRFPVYIDDKIWREQASVIGITGGQIGTLALLKKAMDELKNERFLLIAGLTGHISDATITAIYGTEDYLQLGVEGASIGFQIEYYEGA